MKTTSSLSHCLQAWSLVRRSGRGAMQSSMEPRKCGRLGWLLVAVLLIPPSFLPAQVVSNGDFENGVQGWSWSQQETARGVFSVEQSDRAAGESAARVEVTVNAPAHRLQLMHDFPNDSLQPGDGYVLRFFAKASQPTEFQTKLMNKQKPWNNLGVSKTVAVDADWKEFRFPFLAKTSDQKLGKVNFFLGQAKGTVWIDGVTIEPYDPTVIEPDGPTLKTDRWVTQFFASGAIGRMVHKPSGRVLIEPAENTSAYEITLLQEGVRRVVSSTTATAIRHETFADGQGLRFVADHPEVDVTITYRIDPVTGLLECRSEVSNKTEAAITAIKFPIVHAPTMLGEASDDDVLLYPAFDGVVVDDPKATLQGSRRGFSDHYPGSLSCQLMAYSDPTAGLYLASHDPDGYAKQFTVDSQFQMRMTISHLAPELAGKDVKPPYPIMIGTFSGEPKQGGTSWYDAAEIYRRWSEQQAWAERKVRTRKDTPDWLRRGALVTCYNPRQLTPPGDQSRLKAFIEDYTNRYGLPVMPNNRGFERYGTWCGQEYLPVMPDEATFRGSAEITRQLGGRSMIMLSGYRWTIERTTPEGEDYSSQERFDREVAPWAVHDTTGEPVVKTSTKKNDFHGRKWSRLCRATDFAKSTIVDLSKYFVTNGYSVIHFDQECSGAYAASVCHAKDHGHPPGHGRWVHLAMADLYQQICDTCRPLDPDFMLSMEEPNELYLPWLNLCQSRPFGITPEWPVVAPGNRSVPLFLYLYHENLIGWAAFYPWKSAGRPWYTLAKGFTIGQMPGLVPSPDPGDQFSTLFTRCMTGYRTFAHDYLVWGRMERPLALDVPERQFDWKVKGVKEGAIVVPAVSHAVWRLDNGRTGIVFVNPETESHTVKIDLSPLLKDEGQITVREVSTQGGERTHKSVQLQIEIPPLDMLLLEFPRSSS